MFDVVKLVKNIGKTARKSVFFPVFQRFLTQHGHGGAEGFTSLSLHHRRPTRYSGRPLMLTPVRSMSPSPHGVVTRSPTRYLCLTGPGMSQVEKVGVVVVVVALGP